MREAVGHTRRSSFVRPGLCWRWEETVNVAVNGRGPNKERMMKLLKKKETLDLQEAPRSKNTYCRFHKS